MTDRDLNKLNVKNSTYYYINGLINMSDRDFEKK